MPARTPKRGRPKGSETTVVGLPKKRRRIGGKPVPFVKRNEHEKQCSKFLKKIGACVTFTWKWKSTINVSILQCLASR